MVVNALVSFSISRLCNVPQRSNACEITLRRPFWDLAVSESLKSHQIEHCPSSKGRFSTMVTAVGAKLLFYFKHKTTLKNVFTSVNCDYIF